MTKIVNTCFCGAQLTCFFNCISDCSEDEFTENEDLDSGSENSTLEFSELANRTQEEHRSSAMSHQPQNTQLRSGEVKREPRNVWEDIVYSNDGFLVTQNQGVDFD